MSSTSPLRTAWLAVVLVAAIVAPGCNRHDNDAEGATSAPGSTPTQSETPGLGLARSKEQPSALRPLASGPRAAISPDVAGKRNPQVATHVPGAAMPLSEVPTLTVPRLAAGERIVIDGHIDDDAWARAGSASVEVQAQSGRPALPSSVRGKVRLLWNDAAMYVAFEVADRNITGGFPPHAIDPHLWTRDTVEVMVDPDGDDDNRDYYEIQVNPQNLVFDSQFDSYNQPRGGPNGPFGHQEWSAKLESAVTIAGSLDDTSPDMGYRVELRIPWSSFSRAKRSPPALEDTWRMNFYVMEDNGGSSWSPILGQGNFHRASRFGRIVWAD